MKIAFIAPRFHSNQSRLVSYLLKNNSVDFYVSRLGGSEDYTEIKPKLIEFSNISSFLVNLFSKGKKDVLAIYKFGIVSLTQLLGFIKENYDVVIIRNPYSFTSLCFLFMLKFTKTKIIMYTQHEIHSSPRFLNDNLINFFIWFFNAKWITPCLGNNELPKINNEMYYIPFCSEIVVYKKNWFQKDIINILCIAKYVHRKNISLLIRALNEVYTDKKINFALTVIGEVSESTGREVFEKVATMAKDCAFSVTLLKNLEYAYMADHYKNSDLYVLPSSNEPASVSNLEAMSYGLPVITSCSNKTSTYTIDNGLVFDSDSLGSLVNNLSELLENRELMINMGDKSREVVDRNHNPNQVYNFFEKILLG